MIGVKLQVLVSTMNQNDHSLLDRMNIQTDAIVINQCDRNEIETFTYKGHTIQWFSLNERGVGLSRNTALMRADADIVLFADDDVVYEDGYESTICNAFEKNKNASLMVFNIISQNPDRPEFIDDVTHKLKLTNCLRYGAFRIAIRLNDIKKANIVYSLMFGGGAKYQAGEDNLFITECIKKNLTCYASHECLGMVKQEESTWFKGYNEKYYLDRGALFAAMYGKFANIMLLLFEMKSIFIKKNIPFSQRIKLEISGSKLFLSNERN